MRRRKTHVQDEKGNDLYENDRVLYEVRRVSASQSTWGQETNKNHGSFQVHGTIKFKKGRFVIVGDEKEIRALEKPKGKEQYDQNVWFGIMELATAEQVKKVPKSKGGRSRPLNRYEILNKEITGV